MFDRVLKDGVEKALADDSAQAILVFCEGRTFIAGADISEFSSGPMEPNFHAVLSTMDALPSQLWPQFTALLWAAV